MKYFLLFAAACFLFALSPVYAADPTITILNTVTGENGPVQTTKDGIINEDLPIKVVADLGAGDTYVLQGRATSTDAWITFYTFTADEWKDIFPPRQWRAIRTVDGGADGTVKVINSHNLNFTAH